jgi:hypothetical protein
MFAILCKFRLVCFSFPAIRLLNFLCNVELMRRTPIANLPSGAVLILSQFHNATARTNFSGLRFFFPPDLSFYTRFNQIS